MARTRRILLLSILICLPGTATPDSTRVYRCTGEDGRVEFRQGPCSDGVQQELEIEDVEVGWDAPAVEVKVKKRPKRSSRPSSSSNDKRLREKCLKKRQQLENVNRKLRRGYKAGQGADLRHKRRQHEEYLDQICRSQ